MWKTFLLIAVRVQSWKERFCQSLAIFKTSNFRALLWVSTVSLYSSSTTLILLSVSTHLLLWVSTRSEMSRTFLVSVGGLRRALWDWQCWQCQKAEKCSTLCKWVAKNASFFEVKVVTSVICFSKFTNSAGISHHYVLLYWIHISNAVSLSYFYFKCRISTPLSYQRKIS